MQTKGNDAGTVYFDEQRKLYVGDLRWMEGTVKKRKVFRDKKQSVVIAKMNEYRKQNDEQKFVGIKSDVLFKEYADFWLNSIKLNSLKPTSFMRLTQTLEYQIYPYIGDIVISELTTFDIQSMINKLSSAYAYSTIKKAYDAVNSCLKHFRKLSRFGYDPCDAVQLPTVKEKAISDIKFFREEEIKLIEAEALKTKAGRPKYRYGNAYIILLYTGMRIGELIALTWDDVNFEDKTVSITKNAVEVKDKERGVGMKIIVQDRPKTDSSYRIIPLNTKALTAFRELVKITGDEKYIFSTLNHQIKSSFHMNKCFHSILRNCGIENDESDVSYGVHALRHTCATMLFRNGCPTKLVSQILGHSSTKITEDIYIHIIKEQEVKALDSLDRYVD